jgi:hypothetical protein
VLAKFEQILLKIIVMKLNLLKESNMKLIETTYRTLSGVKKIVEIPKRKPTQWIIYQDKEPKFYVDLYDLSIESNAMMNSLVLCAKSSIIDVLKALNKRNNINLSIPKISRLGIQKKETSKKIEMELQSLPEEWLAYSL